MADTHIPLDIGAQAIIQFQEYKYSAYLDLEKKSTFLWHKNCQKYFIISKGAKNNNWILFCFSNRHATRAEWAYSMLQMESVRKYDKRDVVGFRIVFIEAKMPEIILICDTKENRETWMSNIQEAINETHSFSKDSGFGSGGSIAGLQRSASRQCCSGFNNYDTIDDGCIDKTQDHKNDEKQKKKDLGVENSEETILKLPSPVEATSDLMEMENLKLDISSHKNDSLSQTDSNNIDRDITKREPQHMKPIQRGEMNEGVIRELKSKIEKRVILDEPSINGHNKTVTKVNVHQSNEHFASSQDFDSFQSSSPSNDNDHTNVKEPFASTDISSNDNGHTNFKVPFASSDFSPVRGADILCEVIPAESCSESARSCETESYVSLRGVEMSSSTTTGRYCSESFASVRSGTLHPKTSNAVTRNGSLTTGDFVSFSSNKGAASCSSQTSVKTLAFSKTHSATLPATTQRYILDNENHTVSEETLSFVSVNTHETCSSAFKSESVPVNPNSESIQVVRNVAAEKSFASVTIGTNDSLTKPEAIVECPAGDEEAAIYENTNICNTTYSNSEKKSESRRSSNSSSIHSSNSSSSVSSRESDRSSLTYESPDENAVYENIKHFQIEDYSCKERKSVKGNLRNKAVGTFTVCEGESGKELGVVTPNGVRYFRIREQDRKYSLFKDFSKKLSVFRRLDDLLFCYSIIDLPSQEYSVKLVKGYKAQ